MRYLMMALVFLLAGCESAVPALDAAPDLSVERLELVGTVAYGDSDLPAFLMPDGSVSGQHMHPEDHEHWDDRLGARIMSDGTRWLQTEDRVDGIPVWNVVDERGSLLRRVAVGSVADAYDDFVTVINFEEKVVYRLRIK